MMKEDEFNVSDNDVENFREIFKILSEQLPNLLEAVTKVLYNATEGEKFGQSVAGFYKSLKAAGMSNSEAFELTKEYMSTLSLGGLMKMLMGSGPGSDEVGSAIKARVKREIDNDDCSRRC